MFGDPRPPDVGIGGDHLEVISHHDPPGTVVVRLAGELTIATVDRFRLELDVTETSAVDVLALDLREVTFIDSVALGAIIAAHKRAREVRRRLVVVTAGGAIARLLQVTRLDGSLEVAAEPPRARSA